MSELITVIFDANGGGITVSSKRVTVGEPYGELPPPARFGYEFDGWFTEEQGGELVDADTVVTAESSHALYAHWTKNVRSDEKLKAYRKKKASIKRQKFIIAVSVVLAALVIAGLCVVAYLVNRTNLEDVDGTVYKIIKKGDVYVLCDEDELQLPLTEDGKYYVTAAGSQIKLDAATGQASIYAYVDTVGKEVVGNVVTARILAFPQVERKEMVRLEVHNEHGTYAFCGVHKDGTDIYYIDGHKDTSYNQEQFASLVVSCGYVLAMSKIEEPVVDENGEYSEYGLVAEKRVNALGEEYDYQPAWYKLTDIDGEEYTVIIGDAIVSGAGYYVQYINNDYPDTPFIYIVNTDIGKTVLQPIEALVEPMIVYPMTISTYFNVEKFTVMHADEEDAVSFSFIPLEERIGTQNASAPYLFLTEGMAGLNPHSTNVDACLQSFVDMSFVGVAKLAPTDEDLIKYGVANSAHVVYYEFLVTEGEETHRIEQMLIISEMTDRGTYYVYSALFDMIVEIESRNLAFLEYDLGDWVDTAPFSFNIGCTKDIFLQKGENTIKFKLDNSDTKQFTYTAMNKDSYTSMGYYGDETKYYTVKKNGKYVVVEGTKDGESPEIYAESVNYWLSPENNLYLIKDKSTSKLNMTGGKSGTGTMYVTQYDKKMDAVLYILVDENTGAWGAVSREIQSTDIRAEAIVNGAVKGQVETSYFRHFFQTILYASIEGQSDLTAEERAALNAKKDSEADLVMTINTENGELTFRFFRYSERKVYFTVNGGGNYYMISDRVEKIWTDANKIIAGEDVTATDKN